MLRTRRFLGDDGDERTTEMRAKTREQSKPGTVTAGSERAAWRGRTRVRRTRVQGLKWGGEVSEVRTHAHAAVGDLVVDIERSHHSLCL